MDIGLADPGNWRPYRFGARGQDQGVEGQAPAIREVGSLYESNAGITSELVNRRLQIREVSAGKRLVGIDDVARAQPRQLLDEPFLRERGWTQEQLDAYWLEGPPAQPVFIDGRPGSSM